MLVSTVSEWLPRLSGQFSYVHKTYPILVHGIPISFNMSRTSRDTADLIDSNTDTISQPLALQCMEMLVPKCCSASQSTHGSLIIHFTDLEMADNCIDWHIAFRGRLLPTLKFMPHPLQCYNCHCMGHTARYCRTKTSCGLCSEEHDTRKCRLAQEHRNADLPEIGRASCRERVFNWV